MNKVFRLLVQLYGDLRWLWLNGIVNKIPFWPIRWLFYIMCGMKIGRNSRIGIRTTIIYPQNIKYDNKVNRVDNRIVSISQPWIRPIKRGKVKAPTEFGAKYDVSIDENGFARLEKLSFDQYNESTILTDALERYRQRNGHYPKRVLVDQIYRTKSNRDFCKENGIEMPGPKLGRPPKDGGKKSSKEEYQDNTDRIEVERFFSRDKQSFGAGLITTKLMGTTLTSIAL